MLTSLKYISYIRCLCLSIKVKIRIAVFTVGGAESDTVVYHIWTPISWYSPLGFGLRVLLSWLTIKRTHTPQNPVENTKK